MVMNAAQGRKVADALADARVGTSPGRDRWGWHALNDCVGSKRVHSGSLRPRTVVPRCPRDRRQRFRSSAAGMSTTARAAPCCGCAWVVARCKSPAREVTSAVVISPGAGSVPRVGRHRVAWIEERHRGGTRAAIVTVARVGRAVRVLRRFVVATAAHARERGARRPARRSKVISRGCPGPTAGEPAWSRSSSPAGRRAGWRPIPLRAWRSKMGAHCAGTRPMRASPLRPAS